MCKVISYVVPEGPPYYANGPVKAVSTCETHSWMAEPLAFVDGLCPLGRIEKATEDGLAKIAGYKSMMASQPASGCQQDHSKYVGKCPYCHAKLSGDNGQSQNKES